MKSTRSNVAVGVTPSKKESIVNHMASSEEPVRGFLRHPSAKDIRISALKTLAQAQLKYIELLEQESEEVLTFDLQQEVRRFEAELIRSALLRTGGRQRPAARLLGMKVTTLNTKIRRYRLDKRSESE